MGGRGSSTSNVKSRIDLSNVNKNPKKGLTAEQYQSLERNQTLTKIERNGFISYFEKTGAQFTSWVNNKNLEWATATELKEKGLENYAEKIGDKMYKKYSKGKDIWDMKNIVERFMSENDKRTIAHLKSRTYKGR